ncbi:MAG TPA: rhomboid family intramembrane serine protease [Clostridia bacterium]|nr:rhomboid family intramembrane serine protease [Clostridia bacterium]
MYDADKAADILKLVSLSLVNNAGYINDKSGNPMLYKRELGAESVVYTINAREVTSDLVIFNLDRLIDNFMHTPQSKKVFFYFLFVGEKSNVDEFKHVLSGKFDECYEKGLLCEAIFVDSDNLSCSTISGRKPMDRKLRKALERCLDNLKNSSIDDTLKKQEKEYVQMQRELRPIAKVGFFNAAFVLILINIFVFLVDGYIYLSSGRMPLLALGIQDNELIRNGETWRLVTSMFLHADIAHLAGNMLSLFYGFIYFKACSSFSSPFCRRFMASSLPKR